MNNIEHIFEEYEKSLQNEIEMNSSINESKQEMFNIFNKIVDDFEASLNYASHGTENTNNVHYVESLNIPVDGFLDNPSFYIFFIKGAKDKGAFFETNCYYDEMSDKMPNAKFMYTETEKDYPDMDIKSFRKTMFHELQHAYRHYQILKQEEEDKEINIKVKNEQDIYGNIISDNTIKNLVKYIFYYTNINEINSHFSEMYPFLKNNTNINIKNYKQFLEEIPGYNLIKRLKTYQNYFNDNNIEKLNKLKKQIGEALYNVYKNQLYYKERKLTPDNCFYMTKDKVNNALLYAQKKFYEFLYNALTELKRI